MDQDPDSESVLQNIDQDLDSGSTLQNMDQDPDSESVLQNMDQDLDSRSILQNMDQDLDSGSILQNMDQDPDSGSVLQNIASDLDSGFVWKNTDFVLNSRSFLTQLIQIWILDPSHEKRIRILIRAIRVRISKSPPSPEPPTENKCNAPSKNLNPAFEKTSFK